LQETDWNPTLPESHHAGEQLGKRSFLHYVTAIKWLTREAKKYELLRKKRTLIRTRTFLLSTWHLFNHSKLSLKWGSISC